MDAGFGVNRRLVMFNDFVIVGPESDPAGIMGSDSAVDAMKAIASTSSTFVSRGDDSGTHRLELSLWEKVGITPEGGWYQESGTGMGETLNIANEREAYTISDRGTFLAVGDRLDLTVLVEGDKALLNIYHVIGVNPEKHDTVNVAGAGAFIAFMLAPETQQVIADFGVEEFGQALFTPCADNSCGVEAAEATPVATPDASLPARTLSPPAQYKAIAHPAGTDAAIVAFDGLKRKLAPGTTSCTGGWIISRPITMGHSFSRS
jgi:ABC-type tungstate transport system permease subunit